MEFTITESHPWAGKKLSQLNLPSNELILSISRGDNLILAEGRNEIRVGDRVILFRGKEENL